MSSWNTLSHVKGLICSLVVDGTSSFPFSDNGEIKGVLHSRHLKRRRDSVIGAPLYEGYWDIVIKSRSCAGGTKHERIPHLKRKISLDGLKERKKGANRKCNSQIVNGRLNPWIKSSQNGTLSCFGDDSVVRGSVISTCGPTANGDSSEGFIRTFHIQSRWESKVLLRGGGAGDQRIADRKCIRAKFEVAWTNRS
ncbi:hypothetical protein J437_LFUL001486 [Ladona fulva]|uniref:Uncharacterized protein n=1 Tax=Ladona fulva TaxID=123851 RepID=A0A8K0JWS1_LADFU|nr:hypothetical protein J437_LFUL001486 [Ladona fulva]